MWQVPTTNNAHRHQPGLSQTSQATYNLTSARRDHILSIPILLKGSLIGTAQACRETFSFLAIGSRIYQASVEFVDGHVPFYSRYSNFPMKHLEWKEWCSLCEKEDLKLTLLCKIILQLIHSAVPADAFD